MCGEKEECTEYVSLSPQYPFLLGVPDSSVGKESACNAGDPNIRFLGQEDPLAKGSATHSSILGLPLWLSW